MEYIIANLKLSSVLFTVSVFCTVMFTEIVKKIDIKGRLKGYKVWLPLFFTALFSVVLKFVLRFDWIYLIFVESCMFGFSVFGYEVILKSINKIIEKMAMQFVNDKDENVEKDNK